MERTLSEKENKMSDNNVIKVINSSEQKKPRFGNTEKVAELFCTSKQGIYNMIARGEIPFYKVGTNNHRLLFDLDEIEEIIRAGRIEAINRKEGLR